MRENTPIKIDSGPVPAWFTKIAGESRAWIDAQSGRRAEEPRTLRMHGRDYVAVPYAHVIEGNTRNCLHVLGDAPPAWRRLSRPWFDGPRYEIEGAVYYCGYFHANRPAHAQSHPFGSYFVLIQERQS